MNILISNDDGVDSPGLKILAEVLGEVGDVTVVAPHRERSTSGHSLTLHKPLRVFEVRPKHYAVTGSPADCVYMATRQIMAKKPDVIISGINKGANLGNDVYYSGTVAAAREGAYFGCKAIAFSLCLGHHNEKTSLFWESSARFAKTFVPMAFRENFSSNYLLNVNVPNLPANEIKGVKISKLGRRIYSDVILDRQDPRGRHYYWIGGEYKGFEDIPGSDCVHVDQGYISVTPLKLDSTGTELMEGFKKWEVQFGLF